MSETVTYGFSVGRVLSKSFNVARQNIVLFVIACLILILPGLGVYAYMASGNYEVFSTSYWLSTLPGYLISILLMVVITSCALNTLKGMNSTATLTVDLARHVLPVLAISILFIIALYLGLLLLIFPGIIVACMFFVAVPARVSEGTGVFTSFGRSRALTKGHRWGLFGLMLLIFGIQIAVNLVLGVFSFSSAMAAGQGGAEFTIPWASLFVAQAISAILYVYFFIVTVVSYHELRAEKEGGDADTVASVFA